MTPIVLFTGRIQGWEHCTETLDRLRPFRGIVSLNADAPSPSHRAFFQRYEIQPEDIRYEPTPSLDPDVAACRRFNMDETHAMKTWSMYYHRKRAFEAVPPDAECVISFRADITAETPLPLLPLEPGVVYVPDGQDHNGLNDQIAYGSYDVMRTYCSAMDAIRPLVLEHNVEFHPETILLAHVQREKLPVRRFPYTWSLHPARYL